MTSHPIQFLDHNCVQNVRSKKKLKHSEYRVKPASVAMWIAIALRTPRWQWNTIRSSSSGLVCLYKELNCASDISKALASSPTITWTNIQENYTIHRAYELKLILSDNGYNVHSRQLVTVWHLRGICTDWGIFPCSTSLVSLTSHKKTESVLSNCFNSS